MKNVNESLENISIDHKVIGFCLDYEFFHKVKNILDPTMFSGQVKELYNTITKDLTCANTYDRFLDKFWTWDETDEDC